MLRWKHSTVDMKAGLNTKSCLNFLSLLKQCYQIIASFWILTSVRACHSPSYLVYWNVLWEQCLPVEHCPLLWTGPKGYNR